MYCRHTKHTTFFTITVESFVWEEAIRVCTRLLSRVGSHHIMRISMHGASLTLSHMFLIFNLVQLISMRIDDHPESGWGTDLVMLSHAKIWARSRFDKTTKTSWRVPVRLRSSERPCPVPCAVRAHGSVFSTHPYTPRYYEYEPGSCERQVLVCLLYCIIFWLYFAYIIK